MRLPLPFVLLLLDVWLLGGVSLRADSPGGSRWALSSQQRSAVFRLVREKIPLLVLSVAVSIVTFVVQQRGGTAVLGLAELPLGRRVANALVSYVAYIGKMLWPSDLAAYYPYPKAIPGWQVAGALLVLIGVSVAVIRAGGRRPYLPVGGLWYLGTLVPFIGLVQSGRQSMADRFTYVPLIGLFLMAAWGLPDLLARWPHRSLALPAAAGAVLLACTITSRAQVPHWENSLALWSRVVAVTVGNSLAHHNLAVELAAQGKTEEAIVHYLEALRLQPDFVEAHNNLGVALADRGKIDEAFAHFSEALRLKPDNPEAHNNLGNALANQRKVEEAIAHYLEALRLKPDFAEAHNKLGAALASQGRGEEAIAHYAEALRLKPDFVEAHNNWGNALASQGKAEEAIAQYSEALRIRPDYALGHSNLGIALGNQGRLDEAIQQFQEALRIKPAEAGFHYSIAIMLEKKGDTAGAVRHLESVLQFNPTHEEARQMLEELTGRRRSSGTGSRENQRR